MLLGILNSQAAGGGGAAYDLLETTTLTSSASSVTFSGLGSYSDYAHLQIRAVTRNSGAFTGGIVDFILNSDTGANYSDHYLKGESGSVTSSGGISQNDVAIGDGAGGSNGASQFSTFVADFLDFSSGSKNTTIRSLSGLAASGRNIVSLRSGLYNSTDAITSIAFSDSANFVSGTRFSIYGIKAN